MITFDQVDLIYKAENLAVRTLELDTEDEKRYAVKLAGIEAYEQSKWIKFDYNKELSGEAINVLVTNSDGRVYIAWWDYNDNTWNEPDSSESCTSNTHWQYLPEYKEK